MKQAEYDDAQILQGLKFNTEQTYFLVLLINVYSSENYQGRRVEILRGDLFKSFKNTTLYGLQTIK